ELAKQYYAAGEYYTAAHLYEQYLNPPKDPKKEQAFPVYTNKRKTAIDNNTRSAILYQMAECYRLANYFAQADSLYKECTGKTDAIYWKAVCERSLGKYDEALFNLVSYFDSSHTMPFFKEASQEMKTIGFIKEQLDRPDTILTTVRKLRMPGS